jgi:hypothetical protein
MNPWNVFSGLLNILMIESGDTITELVKRDELFKMLFIFVSVISFVRSFPATLVIIFFYYSLKIAILPFFETRQKNNEYIWSK